MLYLHHASSYTILQHSLRRARQGLLSKAILNSKKEEENFLFKKKRLKKIVMFVSVVNPLGYSYSNIKFKNTFLINSTLQLSHTEQDRKHKTSTTMASTAALFDRQQLQSREDMLMLGQILNDVMQHFIEVRVYPFQPYLYVSVQRFFKVSSCQSMIQRMIVICRHKVLHMDQNQLKNWKHRQYV